MSLNLPSPAESIIRFCNALASFLNAAAASFHDFRAISKVLFACWESLSSARSFSISSLARLSSTSMLSVSHHSLNIRSWLESFVHVSTRYGTSSSEVLIIPKRNPYSTNWPVCLHILANTVILSGINIPSKRVNPPMKMNHTKPNTSLIGIVINVKVLFICHTNPFRRFECFLFSFHITSCRGLGSRQSKDNSLGYTQLTRYIFSLLVFVLL